MDEEEKKKLAERYTQIQIFIESFLKQREEVLKKIDEIEESIKALEDLKLNDEITFSIGTNVFGFGKITEEKFLVNVGANVGIEMSREEAISNIKKIRDKLYRYLENIELNLKNLTDEQNKILEKVRSE